MERVLQVMKCFFVDISKTSSLNITLCIYKTKQKRRKKMGVYIPIHMYVYIYIYIYKKLPNIQGINVYIYIYWAEEKVVWPNLVWGKEEN